MIPIHIALHYQAASCSAALDKLVMAAMAGAENQRMETEGGRGEGRGGRVRRYGKEKGAGAREILAAMMMVTEAQ